MSEAERGPGRRAEDVELRKLLRNKWALRLGSMVATAFFAIASFVAGGAKAEWDRIPSNEWRQQVDATMMQATATRVDVNTLGVRVDNLQASVDRNFAADERSRSETLAELRAIRMTVERLLERDLRAAAAK